MKDINHLTCPLCDSEVFLYSEALQRHYYRCVICDGIHLSKNDQLSPEKEKQRYLEHNNNVADKGYQNFVMPIVNAVLDDYTTQALGLDFGCGTGPVITTLLRAQHYNISLYDPFFNNAVNTLSHTYDYIICCEVIEHFNNPKKEFGLIQQLLKPNGKLYCKTGIYNDAIDFENWWYKNDNTHVFFYTEQTLRWIAKTFQFKDVEVSKSLITLTNN